MSEAKITLRHHFESYKRAVAIAFEFFSDFQNISKLRNMRLGFPEFKSRVPFTSFYMICFFAFWNTFTLALRINVFNTICYVLVLAMTTITLLQSINFVLLNNRHWLLFAGYIIRVDFNRHDLLANIEQLKEINQWLTENVDQRDWSIMAKPHTLHYIRELLSGEDTETDLLPYTDEQLVFIFKYKRDASFFKLTWGGN